MVLKIAVCAENDAAWQMFQTRKSPVFTGCYLRR
jgi:hypothetical protein